MTQRSARILVVVALVAAVAALVLTLMGPTSPPRADLVAGPPAGAAAVVSTTGPRTTPPGPADATAGAPTTPLAPTPTAGSPSGLGGGTPAEPARIRIPAIGVDAPVVAVGLEPDGAMEVPGADQAGWYHPTDVRPGAASGSAVVAAHVDFGGRRGVFFDLRQVPVGAEVVVVDDAGTERRFVVDTRFQVDKDDLPAEELFRTGGPPTLTLITCGGAFDRSVRHYRDNIVLRARPV
jgi:hypothetical protein